MFHDNYTAINVGQVHTSLKAPRKGTTKKRDGGQLSSVFGYRIIHSDRYFCRKSNKITVFWQA